MSFIWPPMLLSILLVPIGLWLYRSMGGRRRRNLAKAYGAAAVAQTQTEVRGSRARYLPAVFIVGGLVVMAVALARPQAVVALPRQEGTVILAFDVSGSMAATDISPTRIAAARSAAKDFVANQPSSISIGVVAFSDSGVSVQVPTTDPATIANAIERLAPQKGTSLASGITASLDAIAAADRGPYSNDYYSNASAAPTPSPTPVPSGYHAPAAIVLLTDGENNERPDPLAAAQMAADRGVRIYTVGIGSTAGATLHIEGFTVHTQLDEAMLKQISQLTDGAYYNAENAQTLHTIYNNLNPQLVIKPEKTEVTFVFAGASMLLLLIGSLFSLVRFGHLP
jgi:Ca-activated chloride channel family protein